MSEERPPIDGQRILQDARALAFPRYPGTEGSQRAILWLKQRLQETGLEVSEEEFSYDIRAAWRALRAVLISCALLLGAAGLLAVSSPGWAAALLVLALVAGGTFLAWAPWIERIYRREGATRTANLVARRAAPGAELTLIFLAHHDSKSQNLSFPWRIGLTLLALAGGLGLAVLLILAIPTGVPPGPSWLPVACGAAAGLALLVLSTLRSGNLSPGGVDNAGSVGILLELARKLPRHLSEEIELIFLSTGAEEDHMVGAMRWLERHRDDLQRRPTFALNIDGAGNPGRVALLERYGFGKSFSKTLSRVACCAARSLEIPVRRVLLPPGMGLDSIPFSHQGVDCLTLSSGSLNRATVAIHSAGDHADNLDHETLERVAALGFQIARIMAQPLQRNGAK